MREWLLIVINCLLGGLRGWYVLVCVVILRVLDVLLTLLGLICFVPRGCGMEFFGLVMVWVGCLRGICVGNMSDVYLCE